MDKGFRKTGLAALISTTSIISATTAQAYPIDCAILLCLSGGWAYPSPDCAVAQIEFMRRITPWPIEPPVQIWNCPLKSSYSEPQRVSPMQRLYDINFPNGHDPIPQSTQVTLPAAYGQFPDDAETERLLRLIGDASGTYGDLTNDNRSADVDISSATFDFLRSIKVYDIRYKIKKTDSGYCYETGIANIGTYGMQGDFGWSDLEFDAAPDWAIHNRNCPQKGKERVIRGVGIEWTSFNGVHDYDFITY